MQYNNNNNSNNNNNNINNTNNNNNNNNNNSFKTVLISKFLINSCILHLHLTPAYKNLW